MKSKAGTDTEFFRTEKIPKILLKIAPPVMLAQLIQAMYNIVDSFFVGKYSEPALTALSDALVAAIRDGTPVACEYSYFPQPMPPELKARQRAAGYALYAALGIGRRDLDGRQAQFDQNYRFFGAPVGVVRWVVGRWPRAGVRTSTRSASGAGPTATR